MPETEREKKNVKLICSRHNIPLIFHAVNDEGDGYYDCPIKEGKLK